MELNGVVALSVQLHFYGTGIIYVVRHRCEFCYSTYIDYIKLENLENIVLDKVKDNKNFYVAQRIVP